MDLYGTCSGKIAYASKAEALLTIDHQMKRNRRNKANRRGREFKLVAYPCPTCHQWHLGSWAPKPGLRDKTLHKRRSDEHVG